MSTSIVNRGSPYKSPQSRHDHIGDAEAFERVNHVGEKGFDS